MLEVLLVVTLSLHLLCVHAAVWAPAWALAAERISTGGIAGASIDGELTRRLWRLAGLGAVVGALLGAALIGLEALRAGPAWQALGRLPIGRWGWFAAELAFSLFLMIVVHRLGPRRGWLQRLRWLLAAAAVANLLYHFPIFFTATAFAAGRLTELPEAIAGDDWRALRFDVHSYSMALHHVVAGLATGGLIAAVAASRAADSDQAESSCPVDDSRRLAVWGARVALGASALQAVIGFWVAMVLPEPLAGALLGGDHLAGGLLAGGVVASLYLMHLLGPAALGDVDRRTLHRASIVLAAVVLLMTAALQRLRTADRAEATASLPPVEARMS